MKKIIGTLALIIVLLSFKNVSAKKTNNEGVSNKISLILNMNKQPINPDRDCKGTPYIQGYCYYLNFCSSGTGGC